MHTITGIDRATLVAFARKDAKMAIGDMNEAESKRTVEQADFEAIFTRTNVAVAADA